MASTPKPVRKARKEFAKKAMRVQGISRKEAAHKAKMSGAGHKFSEMGMKTSGKPKKIKSGYGRHSAYREE